MTKRTLTLTLVAAAAAALLGVAVQARGASSHVLHLKITATKITGVDVPPLITSKSSPETPGDEEIAVSHVGGSATGRRYLVCAVAQQGANIPAALYSCQVTYRLGRSTITAAGVVHLGGTVSAAITGGTGRYAGARGVLVSAPGGDSLTLQ